MTVHKAAAAEIPPIGIVIGTAKDWRITLTSKATGLALPLTAPDKLVFTASRSGAVIFTRKNTAAGGSDAEIALVDGPNGILDVKLVEANTTSLTADATLDVVLRYELASDLKDRIAFVGTLYCSKTADAPIA